VRVGWGRRPSEMEWMRYAIRRLGLLRSSSFRGFCSEGPSLDSAFRKPTRLYPSVRGRGNGTKGERNGGTGGRYRSRASRRVRDECAATRSTGREGPFSGPYTTGHTISDGTVKRKPVLEASPLRDGRVSRNARACEDAF